MGDLQLRVWDKVLFSLPSVYIYRYIPLFDLLMINLQRILRSQLYKLTDALIPYIVIKDYIYSTDSKKGQ